MRYKYICPECDKDMGLWSNIGNTLKHQLCPHCRLRVNTEARKIRYGGVSNGSK